MIVAALRLFGLAAPKWMTPLVKWAIDIAIITAAVGGLFWLHSRAETKAWNDAFNAGWSALAAQDDAARRTSEQQNATATVHADTERATDTKRINDDQGARNDAIDKAKPSATGDATRAANCVRWRNAHPGAKAQPAGC